MTQGERLIEAIRSFHRVWKRWPTYGDLQATRISSAPHKRLAEPGHARALLPGERLSRAINSDGLIVFKLVRG